MFNAMLREWGANRSLAMAAAERTAGMSREDIADRINTHPELVPLVTRLLYEGAMTGQHPVLEAMGAAFGSAIGDLPNLNQYELILGGLRNLQGDDVRLLRLIRDRHVFWQQGDDPETPETEEMQTARRLALRSGQSEELVVFGLVRLTNQGFATSSGVVGGSRFEISEMGRLLYEALERLNDVSPGVDLSRDGGTED